MDMYDSNLWGGALHAAALIDPMLRAFAMLFYYG